MFKGKYFQRGLLWFFLPLWLFCSSAVGLAQNSWNDSFNKAKRILEREVYKDYRYTFYCRASFDEDKNITPLPGFRVERHQKRAQRLEWEHIVPAENFGRIFVEWREGHPACRDNKGNLFKGRKCAEKMNRQFRYMQADMHNLAPSIGAVNAMRRNYNFALLPGVQAAFGSCQMKIEKNRVEPPEWSRGPIARAYKYMQDSYPQYRMGAPQRQLMEAWDRQYPPDGWECRRAARIEAIQGNANRYVKERCLEMGLWPGLDEPGPPGGCDEKPLER